MTDVNLSHRLGWIKMILNSVLLSLCLLAFSACSAKEIESGVHDADEDIKKLFEVRE